eukprot:Amastigsp_a887086_2.p2 type:complete len:101 gc:universal Amastigsp_a887086_2:100-402(+)
MSFHAPLLKTSIESSPKGPASFGSLALIAANVKTAGGDGATRYWPRKTTVPFIGPEMCFQTDSSSTSHASTLVYVVDTPDADVAPESMVVRNEFSPAVPT